MLARKRYHYYWVLGIILAFYFLGTMRLVLHHELFVDEGYYLYAARIVYRGKVPYVDFPFFQAPLLPYVFGLPQALLGRGVLLGRLTSLIFGMVTILLSSELARKLGGEIAGIVTAAMLCATSTFLWVFSTVRTESLTAFLVSLSLYFLLGTNKPITASIADVIAISSAVWAVAVRISCLPAAILELAILLYRNRGSKIWCFILILVVILQAGILFGIPLVVGRDKMIFGIFSAQLTRHKQFNPGADFSLRTWAITVIKSVWDHLTRLYIGVTSGTIVFSSFALLTGLLETRKVKMHYLIMCILALALYLPQIVVIEIGEVYFLASAVVLTIMFGCGISDLYYNLRSGAGGKLVLAIAFTLVTIQAATCIHDSHWHVSRRAYPLVQLQNMAQRVRNYVNKDKQIVTFDTYVAVEADRDVAPGFEAAHFSFFPFMPDSQAVKLGVINMTLFNQALLDVKTACVVLSDYDLRVLARAQGKQPPRNQPFSEEDLSSILGNLSDNYALAEIVPVLGQAHDRLYIFKRK